MDKKIDWNRFVGWYLTLWIIALLMCLFYLLAKRPISNHIKDPNAISVLSSEANRVTTDNNTLTEAEQMNRTSRESEDSTKSLIQVDCTTSGLRFVCLILIMGALGACLHGITSLADHRGRKDFSEEWASWYLYRPFVGGILALIFYLIINGGLMPQVDGSKKEFYGMLGLSGLIGLFSKQALNKLSLIFDAIFASDKEKNEKTTLRS